MNAFKKVLQHFCACYNGKQSFLVCGNVANRKTHIQRIFCGFVQFQHFRPTHKPLASRKGSVVVKRPIPISEQTDHVSKYISTGHVGDSSTRTIAHSWCRAVLCDGVKLAKRLLQRHCSDKSWLASASMGLDWRRRRERRRRCVLSARGRRGRLVTTKS